MTNRKTTTSLIRQRASMEGFLMVLAAWVKKKQFAEGVEVGKKQGKAEERERVNAQWKDLAEEFGIPEDRIPKDDESEDDN